VVAEALTTKGFSRAAVDGLSATKAEPDWLRAFRQRAWDAWEAIPMPTRQDEDWRRTDIRLLDLTTFASYTAPSTTATTAPANAATTVPATATASAPDGPVGLATRGADLAGLLVQRDGLAARPDLAPDLAAQGVLFADLDTAVREHGPLVERHLGSVVPADANKFAALNAALWSGGSFVYVPRGVAVALPLSALLRQVTPGAAVFPRTLIVLDRGASLTFIGTTRSADQDVPAFHAGVVELCIGEGARLRYVGLQNWGGHVWSFTTERAALARDARVEWVAVGLGGRLTKSYVQTRLLDAGASARLVGVVYGGGKQHFDYHTLQEHVAPHTSSDLLFKTALKDQARSVYVGLIQVHKTAQQTDSYLANRNLLLSGTAKADSIPRLEIEANDVRCTHGATVAPVDPEQVFYLETRGLPRGDAVRTIVEGFFEPVLQEIPAETVRDHLRLALAEKTKPNSA
jgi:Fe-S cluster assembly protein SufD